MPTLRIGPDKIVNWDLKRAAVENSRGRVSLYFLHHQHGDEDAFGLHIADVETMEIAEKWLRGGELHTDLPRPVILMP